MSNLGEIEMTVIPTHVLRNAHNLLKGVEADLIRYGVEREIFDTLRTVEVSIFPETHGAPFVLPQDSESRQPRTIQVQAAVSGDGRYFVLALKDDGSLWQLAGLYEGNPYWQRFVAP